jgi:myo-inositol-1(or 4)-monophosphatase
LAYVACGRLEAYYDVGLYPWDAAAGKLLVEEAGGIVSCFGGDPEVVESQMLVATNGRIHAELSEIVLEESVRSKT